MKYKHFKQALLFKVGSIVEPIHVTRTLPLGNVLVFEKPWADNMVFVSVIDFIVPKSAGEAQRYVPFS